MDKTKEEFMERMERMFSDKFVEHNREALEMLLGYHEVPPRRTMVDLSHDVILILCQPTDVKKSTEVVEFTFTDGGIYRALTLLEERRVMAGAMFDSDELSTEEVERRMRSYRAHKAMMAKHRDDEVKKPQRRVRPAKIQRWARQQRPAKLKRPTASGFASNVIPMTAALDTKNQTRTAVQ